MAITERRDMEMNELPSTQAAHTNEAADEAYATLNEPDSSVYEPLQTHVQRKDTILTLDDGLYEDIGVVVVVAGAGSTTSRSAEPSELGSASSRVRTGKPIPAPRESHYQALTGRDPDSNASPYEAMESVVGRGDGRTARSRRLEQSHYQSSAENRADSLPDSDNGDYEVIDSVEGVVMARPTSVNQGRSEEQSVEGGLSREEARIYSNVENKIYENLDN